MKRHTLTILTSLLLLTGSASSAFAIGATPPPECQVDADCGANLVCVASQTDCAVAPCAKGEECPEIDCNASVHKTCQLAQPASCETTTDCGSGLVCMTRTNTTCTAGGTTRPCSTEDGPDCDSLSDTDPQCETSTEGYCVPPYIAPCTDDASCGAAGFTCEVVPVHCGCSGSGSSEPSTGSGSDDVPVSTDAGSDNTAPEDCGCPEPDENNRFCELENISCTTDEECSGDFICHHVSSTPDTSCSYDPATGEESCMAEENIDPEGNQPHKGRCAPADYPYWMAGGQDSTGNSKNESDTGGESNTGNSPGSNSPGDNDSNIDFTGDTVDNSNGCHIASLNTGKTSTTAFLLAGAAALFTFGRRRKR